MTFHRPPTDAERAGRALGHPLAPEIEAAVVPADQGQSLPALIDRAATALASAKTAAEVLEARELAGFAYYLAKRQARIARAKAAHDTVVAAAHRAQADALTIKAQAEGRLADEFDAAQERGEVKTVGNPSIVSGGNDRASAADLGLSRKDIHEARMIRDAEEAHPGIVRQTLDAMLAAGKEPTRAAVKAAVARKKPKTTTKATEKPSAPSRWNPPAQVRAVLEALRDDPEAFRDLLRGVLDFESHYRVADLLVEVFSHRPWFALDVANAVLDRVRWAQDAEPEAALGREQSK